MKFWSFPWAYKQSFIFSLLIVFAGILIEIFFKGAGINLPVWPFNLFLVATILLIVVLLHFGARDNDFFRWLSSVPAAISAIIIYTIVILFMGFVHQKDVSGSFLKLVGVTHITTSWPFLLISLFLITILGLSTMKRMFPFKISKLSFILNHTGLWIVLVAGSMGASDMKRIYIYSQYKKEISVGVDAEKNNYQLPFSIELLQFNIDEYLPELVLVENTTGKVIPSNVLHRFVENKNVYVFNDFTVRIDSMLLQAYFNGRNFQFSNNMAGCVPAAYITVHNIRTRKDTAGWVASGSASAEAYMVKVDSAFSVALTLPRVKNYSSVIRIKEKLRDEIITLEVNKPCKIGKWSIYQTGYDERMGKWSGYSLIEAVNDAWLPVVYTGFFMMLAGAAMLFWQGKRR